MRGTSPTGCACFSRCADMCRYSNVSSRRYAETRVSLAGILNPVDSDSIPAGVEPVRVTLVLLEIRQRCQNATDDNANFDTRGEPVFGELTFFKVSITVTRAFDKLIVIEQMRSFSAYALRTQM